MKAIFFAVKEHPSGRVVDVTDTLDDAFRSLTEIEKQDEAEGIYSPLKYYVAQTLING